MSHLSRYSATQRLARTLDQAWQRIGAVLARVEALGVLGNTGVIHHGEAEAALACCQNMASQRCESIGEGMDSGLDLLIGIHNRVFLILQAHDRAINKGLRSRAYASGIGYRSELRAFKFHLYK